MTPRKPIATWQTEIAKVRVAHPTDTSRFAEFRVRESGSGFSVTPQNDRMGELFVDGDEAAATALCIEYAARMFRYHDACRRVEAPVTRLRDAMFEWVESHRFPEVVPPPDEESMK